MLPVRVVPVIAAGVVPPITAPSTVPASTSTELLVMIDTANVIHASLASFLIFNRFAAVSNHIRPAVRDVAGSVEVGCIACTAPSTDGNDCFTTFLIN